MRPESIALANVLLKHHKRVCRGENGVFPSPKLCVIPYGTLCDIAGVPFLTRSVGQFLQEVAIWCVANNWPPLNSLAVNAATGIPGENYDTAPGCSLNNWPREVEECIQFDKYPKQVP
jgi:hypothetical protein